MSEKEKKEVNINKDVDSPELEQPEDAKVVEADSAKENAEMAKLTSDLEELRHVGHGGHGALVMHARRSQDAK